MAAGIDELQRIVERKRVTIKVLRVEKLGNRGVGLNEPAKQRIIVAGAEIVETRVLVLDLAGVAAGEREGRRAFGKAILTEGAVFVVLDAIAILVGFLSRGVQVVRVVIRIDVGARGIKGQTKRPSAST